jgi:uncharacterized protein (TIGR03083 family)
MAVQQSSKPTSRRPALDRDVAMRLAATEYERVAAMLEQLTPEQWSSPTDCPGWDVRAIAGHLLGMAQMAASLPEMLRQQVATQRRAKRDGGLPLDAMTALQVEKNAHLSAADVVDQMRRVGAKAARSRRRTPAFVRARTVPEPQHVDGGTERWTFGFLLDVILTRDPFMHRIDIATATGVPMAATADHEGVLVDDVVREWAGRHGASYSLDLGGPAGGHWEHGEDGEHHALDAFEYCRTLSGRAPGTGLLTTQVPF